VYVKCELHVESKAEAENNQIPKGGKNKGGELKLQSTARRGHDPDFGSELLRFERVRGVIPALAFLRYVITGPNPASCHSRELVPLQASSCDSLCRKSKHMHYRKFGACCDAAKR
jgi:hypothetical protein